MKKLINITVALCALNEGSNIGDLLRSILKQKQSQYQLDEILIISDGSTDNTVDIIKSFNSPKIRLLDYKKRLGKSTRLNEIYGTIQSEVVVQPDADVILAHDEVFDAIVKPFYESENIGMTGGHPIPLPAETFIEQAVNYTLEAYAPFRESINGGNNILSATGRLLAVRKSAFSKIRVPKDTIANDGFVYFHVITKGFDYRYAPKAKVYFRSPQSLKDHINQNTRFSATKSWMKKYYPPEVIDQEYHIPDEAIKREMLKGFLNHPIHCGFIFLVNKLCHFFAFLRKDKINALWDIVESTKVLKGYVKSH